MNPAPSIPYDAPGPQDAIDARGPLDALDQLGDAAAVLDLARDRLQAVTAAWVRHQPELRPGVALQQVEAVLPGLRSAAQRAAQEPPGACRRGPLGASARWSVEIAALGPQRVLLRLQDRREQGLALQRQLDDREQLMFSARGLAVGEMATTLAHELKQPIGAAANLLRGLRARAARRAGGSPAASGDEEACQALQRALDQLMFASRVITRLREATSTRRPRQTLVDLAALARASVALLDWDFHRSGARVELDLPVAGAAVRGDAVMLQQIIVNLVRNALDALRSGSADDPCVRLALRPADDTVTLEVHDNGCGIPEAMAERLFQPFATTKPTGMGLGLAICRSLAELHQGRLGAEGRPAGGTVFRLALPRATAAQQISGAAA